MIFNNLKVTKMSISEEMCDILDEFIKDTVESDSIYQFCISSRDLNYGKKVYNKLKNSEEKSASYELFGSNGAGYTAFALYKSKEDIIYVIRVSVDTPTDYIKIDVNNEGVFL